MASTLSVLLDFETDLERRLDDFGFSPLEPLLSPRSAAPRASAARNLSRRPAKAVPLQTPTLSDHFLVGSS